MLKSVYGQIVLGLLLAGASLPWAALAEVQGLVAPGIDVLTEDGFRSLAGLRVGLITNHTGRTRSGESTIDRLFDSSKAAGFRLVSLFSPEHGIRGDLDEAVDSGVDAKTGLPIHSLYGKTQKPTRAMLKDLDVLVFDIQDIGTRFYTYIGTMALAMQAAAESGKKFIVLDRPNPIGGAVEGAVPDASVCGGITCIYPIPTRHGMTVGELAKYFNEQFGIKVGLEIIAMRGWRRSMYFDQTGLTWVNPSPNMKTLEGAILYPGMGTAETTDLSVGRGTERPFELYGAPYFNASKIVANLNRRGIPGVSFEETSFVPTAPYHPYRGKRCPGVSVTITDRDNLNSVLAGLHLVQAIYEVHPSRYTATTGFQTEVGDSDAWRLLTRERRTPEQVMQRWDSGLSRFIEMRRPFLLYGE